MTRTDGATVAGPVATAAGTARDAAAALLAALVVAAVAALALSWVPAGNDQALFVHYAERLRAGEMLYTDLWDNKQPGIFGFYALAGALLGEGWPAARTLYALWLGAGAGLCAWIARRLAPGTPAWLIAPLATAGLTVARTTLVHPAQVESLAGTPLAALLLLSIAGTGGAAAERLRWIAMGALVGVVAALKLVLAPVPAALVACALGWRMLRGEMSPRAAVGAGALTLVGFAAAWGPILAWIVANGAWQEFRWTMLDYPRLALAQVEARTPANIVAALRWLAVSVGLMLPAAALWAWRSLRSPRSPAALVAAACAAWVAVGFAMFLTQRFSWWTTHMDLLVWPIGLPGALGAATLLRGASGGAASRALAAACVAAVGLNLAGHGARFVRSAAADPEWPGPSSLRQAIGVAHEVAAAARTPCGTVYAIGDRAGVERATGLRQALPTHGLWFGAFLPAQAERLPGELRRGRPDLVYYDANERLDFARKHPRAAAEIDAWLEADYAPGRVDAIGGRWWQRRIGADDPPACPARERFTIPPGAG
jgi:hypothetical protein